MNEKSVGPFVTSSLSDSLRFFILVASCFSFSSPVRRSGRLSDSGRTSGFPVSADSRERLTSFFSWSMLKTE